MNKDFTFDMYEKLLQTCLASGYEHLAVRDYLQSSTLPEKFVIHRHDIDRKPKNALLMAELEAKYNISSTYYIRTTQNTFRRKIIEKIYSLGHEVGYHYEDLDRADGDPKLAHQLFEKELERVRQYVPVETVCMHGNPLTKYDNRKMWQPSLPSFEQYDLLGEAYLSVDFEQVTYYSDTGRTWADGDLKVKDQPLGNSVKHHHVGSTSQLCDLVASKSVCRPYVLSHPNRWADDIIEYVIEYSKDTGTNLGKRFLALTQ